MNDRIRCDEALAQLLPYLDGEIDDAQRRLIERHLEDCRGCSWRAEFERALKARLAGLGEARAPAALRHRLRQLIDAF